MTRPLTRHNLQLLLEDGTFTVQKEHFASVWDQIRESSYSLPLLGALLTKTREVGLVRGAESLDVRHRPVGLHRAD